MARRARPGHTTAACPGCKRVGYPDYDIGKDPALHYGYERPSDGLCAECTDALAVAQQLKERRAAEIAAEGNRSTFRENWFYPYIGAGSYDGTGRAYLDALKTLVHCVSVPITKDERDWGAPLLFTRPTDRNLSGGGETREHLHIAPDTAAALDALEHAVAALVRSADHEGFKRGRQLLASLASGELTVADYDDRAVKESKPIPSRKSHDELRKK